MASFPTPRLLPPGEFPPVVESSGLMPAFGAWVLGAACRQMRDWRMQAYAELSADDFGTGYSCPQHLKCCPISTLKIDQSIVVGLANDHRDQIIVHTVVQLAHGQAMNVVEVATS